MKLGKISIKPNERIRRGDSQDNLKNVIAFVLQLVRENFKLLGQCGICPATDKHSNETNEKAQKQAQLLLRYICHTHGVSYQYRKSGNNRNKNHLKSL